MRNQTVEANRGANNVNAQTLMTLLRIAEGLEVLNSNPKELSAMIKEATKLTDEQRRQQEEMQALIEKSEAVKSDIVTFEKAKNDAQALMAKAESAMSDAQAELAKAKKISADNDKQKTENESVKAELVSFESILKKKEIGLDAREVYLANREAEIASAENELKQKAARMKELVG